jgi:transposase
MAYRQEQEYLALDITSISSYSKLISEVEWGHNRDKEKLPQVNLCLIMGEKTKLPVYQIAYSGSLTDVTTLQTTLKLASPLLLDKALLVMDKGFYSKSNIDVMLSDKAVKFIIAASFSSKYVCKQVESVKRDIDKAANIILVGEDTILGIARKVKWNSEHILYVHVYHNAMSAAAAKTDLYAEVASLAEIAKVNPHSEKHSKKFKKYLLINETEAPETPVTVDIHQQVLDEKLAMSGWLVIFSNHINDASEAIQIYRAKDAVEKGFSRFKNSLGMERLRVHSSESMENKIFVAFVGLIIMSHIHRVMIEKGLYPLMTMKNLVHTLEKLRVQYIYGNRILFPLTKQQKGIYEAFGFDAPI